jgi:uncharacterized protein (DUF488 family)
MAPATFQLPRVYTVGHSTRPIENFIGLLRTHGIEALADVRSYPGSRRHPQYNREALSRSLKDAGIAYYHMVSLGGRRKENQASEQEKFRGGSPFSAYIDYAKTEPFQSALKELEVLASAKPTAFMCAEADWRNCHRQFIAEALERRGFTVIHIADPKAASAADTAPRLPGL